MARFFSIAAAFAFTFAVVTASAIPARAADYAWTFAFTGAKTCPGWPCQYSYNLTAPLYSSSTASIPAFAASCAGTIDQPLQACQLLAFSAAPGSRSEMRAVAGNFSSYETSGDGRGVLAVTATWFDDVQNKSLTITGVTPVEANDGSTWDVQPTGCPLTAC
ncbi:Uu.00g027080.m01.CDS01 [Anthostomella pinea]|uniref:Uu.00g027080.m01.CDS01 n=1 Tax=Anthostomella pinea TaxID=933095 RepID=A0AAI8V8N8_9PEZI|nr:Uu.00g027080.m01.CDS01 [Anthostomella pinea]